MYIHKPLPHGMLGQPRLQLPTNIKLPLIRRLLILQSDNPIRVYFHSPVHHPVRPFPQQLIHQVPLVPQSHRLLAHRQPGQRLQRLIPIPIPSREAHLLEQHGDQRGLERVGRHLLQRGHGVLHGLGQRKRGLLHGAAVQRFAFHEVAQETRTESGVCHHVLG